MEELCRESDTTILVFLIFCGGLIHKFRSELATTHGSSLKQLFIALQKKMRSYLVFVIIGNVIFHKFHGSDLCMDNNALFT